jgi:hypothetical protein
MKKLGAFLFGALLTGAAIYAYKNKSKIVDYCLKKYPSPKKSADDDENSASCVFYMDENGNIQEGASYE